MVPVEDVIHDETLVDEYRWLEALESESVEVEAWTTTQNAHTRAVLDRLPCRAELETQFEELILKIGSVSAPSMRGNMYFYRQRAPMQNQPVLMVREGIDGEPRTLLDPNELDAAGLISLDWYEPSPDGSLVAF